MSVCAKFQLYSWSKSGLKVPGGVVGWGVVGCGGVETHFSVPLKPKAKLNNISRVEGKGYNTRRKVWRG